jgi:hypothetical protein
MWYSKRPSLTMNPDGFEVKLAGVARGNQDILSRTLRTD